MKLVELFNIIDSTTKVRIWVNDEPEIAFEGCVLEVPWILVDHEIGRVDDEDPIFFVVEKNNYGVNLPVMVVNIL